METPRKISSHLSFKKFVLSETTWSPRKYAENQPEKLQKRHRTHEQMFIIHIYASPFAVILLLLSLNIWLCICRWGFGYNLKDREVIHEYLQTPHLFIFHTLPVTIIHRSLLNRRNIFFHQNMCLKYWFFCRSFIAWWSTLSSSRCSTWYF